MYRKVNTLISSEADIISVNDKALKVIDKYKGDWDMDILQYLTIMNLVNGITLSWSFLVPHQILTIWSLEVVGFIMLQLLG